jgi:hypothetical protein
VQCETYLEGLRADFAAKLVHLVAGARASILSLWDSLLAGPQTRAEAFPAFFVEANTETLTDEFLAAHEAYIVAAQAELASKMPIIKAIEKRTALLEEKVRGGLYCLFILHLFRIRHARCKNAAGGVRIPYCGPLSPPRTRLLRSVSCTTAAAAL